jgi:hypothetical protein
VSPFVAAAAALTLTAGGSFKWDIPEASAWVDVPGTLRVQGVPMKLKMVRSKWQAQPLLQRLVDRFQEAGLYIAPPERQPQLLREVQLTAVDPDSLHTFTFILQPDGDGTTVYLAEANVAAREAPGAAGLPVFPGAQGPVTSVLEGARSLTYRAAAKEAEVLQFYAETLTRAGWQPKSGDRYVKDGREITVSAKAQGPQARVLVWERAASVAEPDK